MSTARLFLRGSTSLHSNSTWTGSSPSTILGIRKLETLGYPKVKTESLCVPSFDTMLQCDGQTDKRANGQMDRQTDMPPIASFAARCKNVDLRKN